MRVYLILILTFSLYSVNIKTQDKSNFSISTFSKLPEDVYGSGCYFFLSDKDEKNSRYICVYDFANTSYISLNGNLFEFSINKQKSNNDNFFVFNKGDYILTIKITKSTPIYEGSKIKGELILEYKNKKINKKIIGYCGC